MIAIFRSTVKQFVSIVSLSVILACNEVDFGLKLRGY